MAAYDNRAVRALKSPHNWVQLAKFCAVGGSGYVVNLTIYALLLDLGPHVAAAISFVVAAANNYFWNRHWTFVGAKGHFGYQGARFLIVSAAALLVNQVWLFLFLQAGLGKITAQAIAIVLVTPLNFVGNKLWSFRR